MTSELLAVTVTLRPAGPDPRFMLRVEGSILTPVRRSDLPRYVRTALNQRGTIRVTYFPHEQTYGDVLDD